MILSDIKRYLRERGQASLQDIALHFDADPEAVRGMLEQWIRKDKVERRMLGEACGSGCTKCDPTGVEFYIWVDQEKPPHWPVSGPECPSGS
jgi:hypothetical protein